MLEKDCPVDTHLELVIEAYLDDLRFDNDLTGLSIKRVNDSSDILHPARHISDDQRVRALIEAHGPEIWSEHLFHLGTDLFGLSIPQLKDLGLQLGGSIHAFGRLDHWPELLRHIDQYDSAGLDIGDDPSNRRLQITQKCRHTGRIGMLKLQPPDLTLICK